MDYKIVADSCCDLTPALLASDGPISVPLTISVEENQFTDDAALDLTQMLACMKRSKAAAKSACPPPASFAQAYRSAAHIFVVTLSSHLSGSHGSANSAKELLRDSEDAPRIHVFDSLSASAGETAVCLKIREYAQHGLPFEEVVERVQSFIHHMHTFFVLENLDTLIKAGRMGRITGYVASVMSLRPIMTADNGQIKLAEKARGSVQAFTRLVDLIGEKCTDFSARNLVIAHCHNEHRANFIRAEAARRYPFRSIHVVPTGGISSMYANEGGVVIAF